jgi:hypothetical protein
MQCKHACAPLTAPRRRATCWNRRSLQRSTCDYSIAGRDIVPLLEAEKVGLLAWSPLAGGLLSGKFSRGVAAAVNQPSPFLLCSSNILTSEF